MKMTGRANMHVIHYILLIQDTAAVVTACPQLFHMTFLFSCGPAASQNRYMVKDFIFKVN